jgi:hypothetical protein
MSQLWLKILEKIGSLRLPPLIKPDRIKLSLGSPAASDAKESMRWKDFLSPFHLFRAWGPLEGSCWEPYHCITLFAALERFGPEVIGPLKESDDYPISLTAEPPPWVSSDVAVICDLPGPLSVAMAAWFAESAGYQPVSTFNNWPDIFGLVKSEKILACLLYYAAVLQDARKFFTLSSPPFWMCDRDRLSGGPGKPREFDNRYYIEESLLAGPAMLKKAGITKVVLLVSRANQGELDDMFDYFNLLHKEGITLLRASLESERTLSELVSLPPRPKPKAFRRLSFKRSSAGGFGSIIPEPSSSSG